MNMAGDWRDSSVARLDARRLKSIELGSAAASAMSDFPSSLLLSVGPINGTDRLGRSGFPGWAKSKAQSGPIQSSEITGFHAEAQAVISRLLV